MRRWMWLVDEPNPAQFYGIISYRDPKIPEIIIL
jgi:hypothetical protein